MGRKKQFALIWWTESRQKDVVALSVIPKPKRQVNEIVTLVWKDFKTRQEIKALAKILDISGKRSVGEKETLIFCDESIISQGTFHRRLLKVPCVYPFITDDENKLHKTAVTENGELHETSGKIFSAQILHEKKNIAETQKFEKGITRSNKKKLEQKIQNDEPIFRKENFYPPDQRMSQAHSFHSSGRGSGSHASQGWKPSDMSHGEVVTSIDDHAQVRHPPLTQPVFQSSGHNNFNTPESSGHYHLPMGIGGSHTSQVCNSSDVNHNVVATSIDHHTQAYQSPFPQVSHSSKQNNDNYPVSSSNYHSSTGASGSYLGQAWELSSDVNFNTVAISTDDHASARHPLLTQQVPQLSGQINYDNPAPSRSYQAMERNGSHASPSRNSSVVNKNAVATSIDHLAQVPISPFPQQASYFPANDNDNHPASSSKHQLPSRLNRSHTEKLSESTQNHNLVLSAHRSSQRDYSDSESSDMGSDNDEASSTALNACISIGDQAKVLSGRIPWAVTKENIDFFERTLALMREIYIEQNRADIGLPKLCKVSAEYTQERTDKVEISPNSGFFLSKSKVAWIDLKFQNNQKDWKIIVRETITEIYGSKIRHYSATGKRGKRPAIDPKLFKGLFEWVNRSSTELIEKKDFITFINKIASNKRKTPTSKVRCEKRSELNSNHDSVIHSEGTTRKEYTQL